MKKSALIFLTFLIIQNFTLANPIVFNEDGKFGLKDNNGNVIVDPDYNKLIRLGENGWIIQKGSKFGIINSNGDILVKPKYNRAERILGKYAKFIKGSKCGLYDEQGFVIIPTEYNSIDILYGGMLLTYKNYKYGISDLNGQVIVDNLFDDIYMPKPNIMIISYNGQQYKIENINSKELTLPIDMASISENENIKITELIQKPVASTGYYSVTATNYVLKVFSSISTAYEETIDELMFLQGADAAGTLINFSWIPKFPIIYTKKYCEHLIAPNNGPLKNIKTNLKKQIKD